MKYMIMVERRMHVCRRPVAVPDDFDPDNAEHLESLEAYYDGQDFSREDVDSSEWSVHPLTTAAGDSVSGIDHLTWEDLTDE